MSLALPDSEQSSPPASVLVLARHGETLGNREGRFQTYDTPLSDTGREQAHRLADRIAADEPIAAVYSSDLARAIETAAIVGRRVGLTPIAERAFRELDVGDWKGLLRGEVMAQYPGGFAGWLAAGGRDRLPGKDSERCEDVARRASEGLRRIATRHTGERVVVISHGLTLAILLGDIHGWDRADTLRSGRAYQGNTAVNIIEVDPSGGQRCLLLGCTAHLNALAAAAEPPSAV